VLEDAAAAGVVAGAAADALVGVTAGALVVAAAGAVVAVEAGVVAGAVAEAAVPVPEAAVPEAGDAGAVKVNAGDGGDVALVLLADAVLGDDTMLATRTPTPSAAPLSSVTRGMLTFMPSNTQSGPVWVRWPGPGAGPHRGREPS
jgi:hypothetical protein